MMSRKEYWRNRKDRVSEYKNFVCERASGVFNSFPVKKGQILYNKFQILSYLIFKKWGGYLYRPSPHPKEWGGGYNPHPPPPPPRIYASAPKICSNELRKVMIVWYHCDLNLTEVPWYVNARLSPY